MLQTIASQVGTAIQNFRLLEGTEVSLQEISVLYGGSRKISQAQSAEEIYQIINNIHRHVIKARYLRTFFPVVEIIFKVLEEKAFDQGEYEKSKDYITNIYRNLKENNLFNDWYLHSLRNADIVDNFDQFFNSWSYI